MNSLRNKQMSSFINKLKRTRNILKKVKEYDWLLLLLILLLFKKEVNLSLNFGFI